MSETAARRGLAHYDTYPQEGSIPSACHEYTPRRRPRSPRVCSVGIAIRAPLRLLARSAAATSDCKTPPLREHQEDLLSWTWAPAPLRVRGARPSGALETDSRVGTIRADSRYHSS